MSRYQRDVNCFIPIRHPSFSDVSDEELEEGELVSVDEVDENDVYQKHMELNNGNGGTRDFYAKSEFQENFDQSKNIAHVHSFQSRGRLSGQSLSRHRGPLSKGNGNSSRKKVWQRHPLAYSNCIGFKRKFRQPCNNTGFYKKRKFRADTKHLNMTKKRIPVQTTLLLENGKPIKPKGHYDGTKRPFSVEIKHDESQYQTHPCEETKNYGYMDFETGIKDEREHFFNGPNYKRKTAFHLGNVAVTKDCFEIHSNNGNIISMDPEMQDNNPSPSLEERPLSIEKLKTSSDDFKQILGGKITKIVMESNMELVEFQHIFEKFAHQNKPSFESIESIRKFIEGRYAQSAVKVHCLGVERPQLNLKICSKYTNEVRNSHECNDLHICKFYLIGECSNSFCKFGHNLKTNHNFNVLKLHNVERLHGNEIRIICQDVRSRNCTTLPIVCRFYNQGGCSKWTNCPYLHVCSYFIEDDCKFNSRCKRSHSLHDSQPLDVLRRHGIGEFTNNQMKEWIQKAIRGKVVNHIPTNLANDTVYVRDPLDHQNDSTKRYFPTVDVLPLEMSESTSRTMPILKENKIATSNDKGHGDIDVNTHNTKLSPWITIKQEECTHPIKSISLHVVNNQEIEGSRQQTMASLHPDKMKTEIPDTAIHIDDGQIVQEGKSDVMGINDSNIETKAEHPSNASDIFLTKDVHKNRNAQGELINQDDDEDETNVDKAKFFSIRVDLGDGKREIRLENGQWTSRGPDDTFRPVSERMGHQLNSQLGMLKMIMGFDEDNAFNH
ncbi:uncharacterized protein LOC128220688 [Mya arenaria]|uniref:uncharacterized protein LOC128220688 n=1 Tax=Mya arenaria TaxID=6604 RepID=UPI0022E288CE|nr:uncharacterized protein LOC128220688 [Mya arenaria]